MLSQLLSMKALLVIVTLIGMAMCAAGIGRVAAQGAWLHPMAILAYIVGALILGIVVASLFDLGLPLVASPRSALVAVLVLAAVKVVITRIHAL